MIYELPTLKYPYDALEPFIDARTMEIHYTRHHSTYISNLNVLLDSCPKDIRSLSLEEILTDISRVPEEYRQGIRNNAGGHLNHTLFWDIMGPNKGADPTGQIKGAIQTDFGSVSNFKENFTQAALQRFGSGWAWLCLDTHGKLIVVDTPNQDSPYMHGHVPILGVDVWEHAYYLKYQNRRADYVKAWWNVINWDRVTEIYLESLDIVQTA
jgi:Fe-Mn family superoxide dismutase